MRSRLILALAALLIAALALGGWLLGRRSSNSAAISQTTQVEDLHITLQLDQAALGLRTVEVVVQDSAGQPLDVRGVRLRFTMAEMDMGQIEADAQPTGRGRYQTRGAFFSMVGTWRIEATLDRAGRPSAQATFAVPIAAPGEAGGPVNPLRADAQIIRAGQLLYQANCVVCHGATGKGDGPTAAGLNPRPADFTQHMVPGKHTDGQVFLWIKDGFPGTAMPAWGSRLSDEQIWQLVSYVRTFGPAAPIAGGPLAATAAPIAGGPLVATPVPGQALPGQLQPVPDAHEPLPPLIFARQGNICRSDGTAAPPQQLTTNPAETYAQDPVISPDGTQVAFVALVQPAATAKLPIPTSVLYVMNLDGSGLREVWKPQAGLLGLPTWAPDARSLYVAANGVRAAADSSSERLLQVMRVDLAGGAARPLLNDALDPTISRDGKQLAYLTLKVDGVMSLALAAPDGSGARTLIDGSAFQGFYAPRFSPDGTRIVVAAIGGPKTDSQGMPVAPPSGASPIDTLLGLQAPATADAHGLPWDLWVINTDGSGLRRLTNIYEDLPMAAFAPDGQQIAMMGAGGIYRMDADGGNLRRIDPVGDHGGLDWVRP
jgi:mono/diheme cytochrome c family protein/Tol biopolymer transport system component